jgi:hypothetical protein
MFATFVKCADFGYLLKCLPVINRCFIALTVSLKEKPMRKDINMELLPIKLQSEILSIINDNKPRVKFDGTIKLIDNVNSYLSDKKNVEIEGLNLRSRQIREAINIFKITILRSNIGDKYVLSKSDIALIRHHIAILKHTLKSINLAIKLERLIDSAMLYQKP